MIAFLLLLCSTVGLSSTLTASEPKVCLWGPMVIGDSLIATDVISGAEISLKIEGKDLGAQRTKGDPEIVAKLRARIESNKSKLIKEARDQRLRERNALATRLRVLDRQLRLAKAEWDLLNGAATAQASPSEAATTSKGQKKRARPSS